MEDKEAEYQKVEAEVQRRKERARELGVDKFMGELFNHLQYYPSWFKNSRNRTYTPIITDARELEKENRNNNKWRKWQITLKGNNYIFAFKEDYASHGSFIPQGFSGIYGTFEVYYNDKKVLGLGMFYKSVNWEPCGIEAFREGEWIEDFKELYEVSKKAHEEGLKNLLRKPLDKLTPRSARRNLSKRASPLWRSAILLFVVLQNCYP